MPDPTAHSPSGGATHHEETVQPLGYTIRPGLHTEIRVRGLPDSACSIVPDGGADVGSTLKIFAGPDGEIRFHAHFEKETHAPAQLVVVSTAEDRTTRTSVHLRCAHEPSEGMPFPPAHSTRRPAGSRVRPALSHQEALQSTDQALAAGGYPMRPDQTTMPDVFNHWLRVVTVPMTVLDPHVISDPDKTHGKAIQAGPASAYNWSGFELLRSLQIALPQPTISPPFAYVYGVWVVPAVTGEAGKTDYSALWVGLDGDGTADLVQAGTEQDCQTIVQPGGGNLTVSNYYAWTELVPQQPTEQQITNFAVSPGDLVGAEVWIANGFSLPTIHGATAFFTLYNFTTNNTLQVVTTPVGGTVVGGSEAVWIMERPTLTGGVLTDLANYGSAQMQVAVARQSDSVPRGGFVGYLGHREKQITMNNQTTGQVMSTVTSVSDTVMRFDWKAFI